MKGIVRAPLLLLVLSLIYICFSFLSPSCPSSILAFSLSFIASSQIVHGASAYRSALYYGVGRESNFDKACHTEEEKQ